MSTECIYGHTSGRYACGKCKDCSKGRAAAYRAKNLDAVRARDRESARRYALRHPEAGAARYKKWQEANPEKYKEASRVASRNFMRRNKAKAKAWMDKWAAANPHILMKHSLKRRGLMKQAVPAWSEQEKIVEVYRKAKEYGFEVDHVVPLNHKLVCGLHVWANLQLLSKEENLRKRNYHWPDMP